MSTNTNPEKLKQIIEGALLAAGRPLGVDQLLTLFLDEEQPSRDEIRIALTTLQEECAGRGIELKEVSSGFRYQVKTELAEWVSRLWEEKPSKYSRATLETLALIAYRQPITRSEIEDVRGVSVSSNIVKSLLEREWIRVIGHRDVPGKPALYGTSKGFLDYFNLKSLSDLPPLAELRNIESIEHEFDFGEQQEGAANDAEREAGEVQPVALADSDEQDEAAEQVEAAEADTPESSEAVEEETTVAEQSETESETVDVAESAATAEEDESVANEDDSGSDAPDKTSTEAAY